MILHLLLLGTPMVWATTFMAVPFSDFTRESDVIVRGVIRSTRVDVGIVPDGSRTVYTFARLEVSDVIKGGRDLQELTLRKTGGTKEDLHLEIPGSPEFVEGAEGLWFLRKILESKQGGDEPSYEVQGLELGQMRVEGSGEGGVIRGGLLALSTGSSFTENRRPWKVHELKELVRVQEEQKVSLPTHLGSPSPTAPSDSNARLGSPIEDQRAKLLTESHSIPELTSSSSDDSPRKRWTWAGVGYLGFGLLLLIFFFFKRKRSSTLKS